MNLRHLATAICFGLVSGSTFAQSDQTQMAAIKKTVARCVNVVHDTKREAVIGRDFYDNFDAFYNPASGNVENSANSGGVFNTGYQEPLFVFNKCMSEQGVPLTYQPPKTSPASLSATCSPQEMADRYGDCWIKLSPHVKQMALFAFQSGAASRMQIQELANQRNPGTGIDRDSLHYPIANNLVAGLDALYSIPENKTISVVDAADLVMRQEQVAMGYYPFESSKVSLPPKLPATWDMEFLQKMYRKHERPLLSGYVKKFLPPNKLVVTKWNDSPNSKVIREGWGNPTQTITILGLDSTNANPAFVKFMSALLNIKACHGMLTEVDAMSHLPNSSPQTQKVMRDGDSSELPVVMRYPTAPIDSVPQFFNSNGELSAEILLDVTHTVCGRISENKFRGAEFVNLGEVMVPTKEAQEDYASPSESHKYISLNAYILANGLHPPANASDDVRPHAEIIYPRTKSVPDAVATVLKIGAVN